MYVCVCVILLWFAHKTWEYVYGGEYIVTQYCPHIKANRHDNCVSMCHFLFPIVREKLCARYCVDSENMWKPQNKGN